MNVVPKSMFSPFQHALINQPLRKVVHSSGILESTAIATAQSAVCQAVIG